MHGRLIATSLLNCPVFCNPLISNDIFHFYRREMYRIGRSLSEIPFLAWQFSMLEELEIP
jgi:hypothetical protein